MSEFRFRLDEHSTTRPWEQLRRSLRDAIANGALPSGYRLPSIRALADDVGLAPNTVARAIKELESDGVLVTRGRHGTFVQGADQTHPSLEALAVRYVSDARRVGATNQAAIEAVRQQLG